jgi:hypothetical protein
MLSVGVLSVIILSVVMLNVDMSGAVLTTLNFLHNL